MTGTSLYDSLQSALWSGMSPPARLAAWVDILAYDEKLMKSALRTNLFPDQVKLNMPRTCVVSPVWATFHSDPEEKKNIVKHMEQSIRDEMYAGIKAGDIHLRSIDEFPQSAPTVGNPPVLNMASFQHSFTLCW